MTPPPCRRMGRHCHALAVTLHVGTLEGGPEAADHEATWLLGHTERIDFTSLWTHDGDVYAEAVIHVPCRHLQLDDRGRARCAAHGFRGPVPPVPRRRPQPRQLGGDRFRVVERAKVVDRRLPAPTRMLPVIGTAPESANPCAGVPCRTSDHRPGAACCRDLQIEIMCDEDDTTLEALVRHRRPPLLCRVEREGKFSLAAEVISACGYLEAGGVDCTLHGRKRGDGRTAKPALCFDWPPKRLKIHKGCAFASRAQRKMWD